MTAAPTPAVTPTPTVATVPSMMVSVVAALNSVGFTGWFVLDSRFRGNDDLWVLPPVSCIASSWRNALLATGRTCPSPTATARLPVPSLPLNEARRGRRPASLVATASSPTPLPTVATVTVVPTATLTPTVTATPSLTVATVPAMALNSVGCAELFVLDTGSSPVWKFCFFTLPVSAAAPSMTVSAVVTVTVPTAGNGTVVDATASGDDGVGDGGTVVVGGGGVVGDDRTVILAKAGIQSKHVHRRSRRHLAVAGDDRAVADGGDDTAAVSG